MGVYRKSNLLNTLRPLQPLSLIALWQRFTIYSLPASIRLLLSLFIICVASGPSSMVFAQEWTWQAREGLPVGSEAERYLRILQLAGTVPLYPWTVQGTPPEALSTILPTSAEHPWRDRMKFDVQPASGLESGWIKPRTDLFYNSAYPFGENDGAVWAGRGLTAVLKGGAIFRYGSLHLRLTPEVFWSQNQSFDLADNGRSGIGAYWDERGIHHIDKPQRFGDEDYARLGLGSSSLSIGLPGVTLGISGDGQRWGPALQHPLLLGNNAGGFPHVFGQTTHPLNLWVMRLHGRYIYGWQKQSEFSPALAELGRRFVTGAVVTLLPRGLDGLEFGIARFIHSSIQEGGFRLADALRVFTGVAYDFESGLNLRSENQLGSLFFRWVYPRAGVEVFGELIKEDYARDLRHIIEEPDDFMGRVFGFQKVWSQAGQRIAVVRVESVNALVHHSERFDRLRVNNVPMPLYTHGSAMRGHTHLGQLLGSPAVYGGSGWTVGVDWYSSHGRWTVDLSRVLQTEFSAIHERTKGPGIADVIYALKMELMRFRRGMNWLVAVTPSLNLNRNLVEENDAFNLSLRLSMNGLPW